VPYGIDMVGARDVWDANRDGIVDPGAPTGANRKICIIDSGFLATQEDLQGINVTGYNGNLPWNQDGDGHGTHVAGTIAAMNNNLGVVGVTPGTVQLYIVRVFGNDGKWAYSPDLIDAANCCASAGSNIISMSLGSSGSSSTEQAKFNELNAQGILSIAAASNNGTTAFSYPASYSSVISVAATDSSKVVAWFSQRNNQVDIAAPGVGIRSTNITTSGYVSKQGPSMATPHVSAVAALIWSAKPSATNEQVRTALINAAEDLGAVGRDDLYGYGLVNAKRAIDYLVTSSISPISTPAPTNISQSQRVYTSGTQTDSRYNPGATDASPT
jgi:serine protease